MFQESPCTGADRRELRCSHEVKEAPSSEVPAVCHWLCFLYGQKGVLGRFTWQSAEQCQRQTENFRRRSLAFSLMQALHSLPLPLCLLTVPVSCNFLNSLLTPRFVQLFPGNSSVTLFAVCPFKYKLLIKILLLLNIMLIVDKHCSDVCGEGFPMPQIDRQRK